MIRAITAKPCGRAVVSPFAKKLSKNGPVSRAVRVRAEDEEAKPSSGHSTGEQPEISEEMKKEIEAYKENEKNAARLTPAEELRTLVASAKFGTLSTLASTGAIKGYPLGSVLPYAIDDDGNIICALSNLSSHKKDLMEDGRSTVTVTQDGFKSMADARCTVSGTFEIVPDDERAAAREAYMKVHTDSYWVDFGDFDFLRMKEVARCHLIQGFGRIFTISAEEYSSASPDPVAKLSPEICKHMNEDHADSIIAMVGHIVGMQVDEAQMLSVDRLGVSTQCRPKLAPENRVNIRLSFPEPAETRGALKDQIVAMTKAAKAAAKEAEEPVAA